MPNHITTTLTVSGDAERVRAMFEVIRNDEIGLGSIDFNKIIPMPAHIFRGNLGPEERAKYGKDNWYDWSLDHWGTKWNCYGFDSRTPQTFDGSTITFQTAWSFAQPVIDALAEQYPELDFAVKWADEDFGYNVGRKEYEAGREVLAYEPAGGSKEALELAAEVHEVELADEGYLYNEATGQYEYHDPEEAPMSMQLQ